MVSYRETDQQKLYLRTDDWTEKCCSSGSRIEVHIYDGNVIVVECFTCFEIQTTKQTTWTFIHKILRILWQIPCRMSSCGTWEKDDPNYIHIIVWTSHGHQNSTQNPSSRPSPHPPNLQTHPTVDEWSATISLSWRKSTISQMINIYIYIHTHV